MLIDGVFYVVWLDRHHNLTNSEGYGKAVYYKPAKSTYELMLEDISNKEKMIESLKAELNEAYELLDEKTAPNMR